MKVAKVIGFILLLGIYTFVSSSLLLFHGPFGGLRDYVMGSFATSRHGYLLRPLSLYTISQKQIDAYNPNLMNTAAGTSSAEQANKDYSQLRDTTITVQDYQGKTFSAKIMLIHDPLRLHVATTSHLGDVGETVSELVSDSKAVAGVNGGAFQDVAYRGTGGVPLGITISNGKIVQANSQGDQPIIGLTNRGALIAGSYSLSDLQRLHVDEALSFGPVLIQNGKNLIQGVGGWGFAPRTAIGQKSDGTIILIVTDGRFIHGPSNVGASLGELSDLMAQYGAVVAANLDGGSSTTMVQNGKLVNEPTDILGERKVATAWVVSAGR